MDSFWPACKRLAASPPAADVPSSSRAAPSPRRPPRRRRDPAAHPRAQQPRGHRRRSARDRRIAEQALERDGAAIGYAIVTYGFDLEFGGRDAFLTELWIDREARGGGAGSAALALLDPELRARGVNALHLQVRPDNPALRLYQRAGFIASPRITMTRRL